METLVISNRYKDILDKYIDSSNTKSSDCLKPIDIRLYNITRSQGSSIRLL